VKIDDRFDASPDVVARVVGGETMLLDMTSGTYFGLDEIGGQVWEKLEEGVSLAQACDSIERDYDVERAVLERDVLALAGELVEKKLIVPLQ
jgi:hypothetical protein